MNPSFHPLRTLQLGCPGKLELCPQAQGHVTAQLGLLVYASTGSLSHASPRDPGLSQMAPPHLPFALGYKVKAKSKARPYGQRGVSPRF